LKKKRTHRYLYYNPPPPPLLLYPGLKSDQKRCSLAKRCAVLGFSSTFSKFIFYVDLHTSQPSNKLPRAPTHLRPPYTQNTPRANPRKSKGQSQSSPKQPTSEVKLQPPPSLFSLSKRRTLPYPTCHAATHQSTKNSRNTDTSPPCLAKLQLLNLGKRYIPN
jgi:hypothetical protein